MWYHFVSWLFRHRYEFEQDAFAAMVWNPAGMAIADALFGVPCLNWDRLEPFPQRFLELGKRGYWTGNVDDVVTVHQCCISSKQKLPLMNALLGDNTSLIQNILFRKWRRASFFEDQRSTDRD